MRDRVYRGDTAIIEANLYDEDGVSHVPVTSVSWQVRKPDGSVAEGGPTNLSDSSAAITFSDTSTPGQYTTQITFTLVDNSLRSTVASFEVVDPLATSVENDSSSPIDKTIDFAWMKLEDLFDSELGGPYLRDQTLANFDRTKLGRLLPSALYNINNYYQPSTGYDTTTFPFDHHMPLLAQGLLVEGIRHLIRSYVEQPLPSGPGTPSYFNRRDYLNRWQTVLQSEEQQLNMWLDLFKRGEMNFGDTALLVGGYASYPSRIPRYMRGRYPYVYRG